MEIIFIKWFAKITITYVHCCNHSRYSSIKSRPIALFTMDPDNVLFPLNTCKVREKKKNMISSPLSQWLGSEPLLYFYPLYLQERKGLTFLTSHDCPLIIIICLCDCLGQCHLTCRLFLLAYDLTLWAIIYWHFWDPIYCHVGGLYWSVIALSLYNPWIEHAPYLLGSGRSFLGRLLWDGQVLLGHFTHEKSSHMSQSFLKIY